MQPLKLRLIEAGCFVSILGAVLSVVRGYALFYLGLLIVGVVVLVVGLLWPKAKPRNQPADRKDSD